MSSTHLTRRQRESRREIRVQTTVVGALVLGVCIPGAQIHHMQAFDIGLFKGESWPNNAGRGAVHRSPAPDRRDQWRVMVSLDELD